MVNRRKGRVMACTHVKTINTEAMNLKESKERFMGRKRKGKMI